MGLDIVELVLRTEEVFSLDLPDDECGQVQTVGDLYHLVLSKLKLPYEIPERPGLCATPVSVGESLARKPPERWLPAQVWITIRYIVIDQLQVREDEVTENARFQDDLRAD